MTFATVPYRYPVKKLAIDSIAAAYIDEGRGPALVFLHGNGADLSGWDLVYPAFIERYRVIGIDLPGYGKSAKPRLEYSPAWYVQFLDQFLQKLGITRAVFIGHSYGGQIALTFTLRFSEKVRGLVLVASTGGHRYDPAQEMFMRAAYTVENMLRVTPQQLRTSMQFALGQWKPEYEPMVERWVALSKTAEYADYAHAVNRAMVAIMEGYLGERLHEIRQPALLIWGDKDAIVPLQAGKDLQAALPNARLEIFENTGHFPMLVQTQRLNQIVDEFLTTIP